MSAVTLHLEEEDAKFITMTMFNRAYSDRDKVYRENAERIAQSLERQLDKPQKIVCNLCTTEQGPFAKTKYDGYLCEACVKRLYGST